MLDAPVSRGDVGAEEGTLSIMVGGDKEDFEHARPLFEVMGGTVTHVGPSGAGQLVKAPTRSWWPSSSRRFRRHWSLARGRRRPGEDPRGALRRTRGQQGDGGQAGEVPEPRLRAGRQGRVPPQGSEDRPGSGQEYGVPLPVTAVVCQMFEALMAKGRGGWDHSSHGHRGLAQCRVASPPENR